MKPFTLRVSAFAICWLRAYDFRLKQGKLKCAVENLKTNRLVERLAHIANAEEIDEVDRDLFDVRYQEDSKLVRIRLRSFELVNQKLKTRSITSPLAVNLLLDTESGFGVFNLCLSQPDKRGGSDFTMEDIGFLTRQWLLAQDESGQPMRLDVRLPFSDQATPLYMREVMNFYFLQIHSELWEAVESEPWPHPENWLAASHEADPLGCEYIRKLCGLGLVQSLYPTSFGPVLDIWRMEDLDPTTFNPEDFCRRFESEIAWLFTDGRSRSWSHNIMPLQSEEQTASRALFVWPNHAIYINQDLESFVEPGASVMLRAGKYGCVDVEVVRILEVLNLQSALMRAFDRRLDQQLEQVSSVTAQDQRLSGISRGGPPMSAISHPHTGQNRKEIHISGAEHLFTTATRKELDQQAVIRLTIERRDILRSMRSFDFFNLFHTTHWEPLFVRLLETPRLNFRSAEELIGAKLQRLDEEIQHAIIIQDRTRQQQQREQELSILRGIHGLSLANDIQSSALKIINFVVSATASFGFTEVLSPLLTSMTRAHPSFQEVYPLHWIALNVGIFGIFVLFLNYSSSLLIGRKSRVIELDGQLDLPCNIERLQDNLARRKDLEYFYFDMDGTSGRLRIRKPDLILTLEFDCNRYLFSVGLDLVSELDRREMSTKLREQFREHGAILTSQALVEVKQAGRCWIVADADGKHLILSENQTLNVYCNRFSRFALFLQGSKLLDSSDLKNTYVEKEIQDLQKEVVSPRRSKIGQPHQRRELPQRR